MRFGIAVTVRCYPIYDVMTMVACAARLPVRPVCQIRTSHLMSRCVPEVQGNTRDHNDDVHTCCSSTTCTSPVRLLQSDAQPTPSVLPVPSPWNSAMVSSYPPFFLFVSPAPLSYPHPPQIRCAFLYRHSAERCHERAYHCPCQL